MSLQVVAHKDALAFSPVVTPVDDTATYHAQIVVHHRAPEVYEMLFGAMPLPKMRKRRHLRAIA